MTIIILISKNSVVPDNLVGGKTELYYKPYIDGEKELWEINAEYAGGKIKG